MTEKLVTTKPQQSATRVVLVNASTYTKYVGEQTAQQFGFKASYKQTFLLPEKDTLLVGTELEQIVKNSDVFYKVNPYQLGAVTVRALENGKVTNLEVEGVSEVMSEQSEGGQTQWLLKLLLGMHQAAWHYDEFMVEDKSPRKDLAVSVGKADRHLVTDDMARELQALHQGVSITRYINEVPPEEMNPERVQDEIYRELNDYENVSVSIQSSEALRQWGMNAILAVGRGSRWEPNLTHVVVQPRGEVKQRICLVGKGITYDSGGLDIKYAGMMKTMKRDLGGAATMFGVTKALAELGLEHTEVHWITPFVENMPDGSSYKADDIIRTYSGQTMEVVHTDAEGRITMADALTYATLQDPDYIIDAATLTGSAMRSFTEYASALMSNDSDLASRVLETFEREQEITIRVPMLEAMRDSLKGNVSDLRNLAHDLNAGYMTAGLFLSHFVDQNLFRNEELGLAERTRYPWVHLDIAGSAMNEGKNDIMANGATGQCVRSLVRHIRENDF